MKLKKQFIIILVIISSMIIGLFLSLYLIFKTDCFIDFRNIIIFKIAVEKTGKSLNSDTSNINVLPIDDDVLNSILEKNDNEYYLVKLWDISACSEKISFDTLNRLANNKLVKVLLINTDMYFKNHEVNVNNFLKEHSFYNESYYLNYLPNLDDFRNINNKTKFLDKILLNINHSESDFTFLFGKK